LEERKWLLPEEEREAILKDLAWLKEKGEREELLERIKLFFLCLLVGGVLAMLGEMG